MEKPPEPTVFPIALLPVLCWCEALVFWLVQGAVAFAGDSSAKAKGTPDGNLDSH